jgi:hypothetical protein
MKGIELQEVRQAISSSFGPDDFDMLLYERLQFDRQEHVADGPFKRVVFDVLRQSAQEGWDALLVAEVARARPLRNDVQKVYAKYAQGLVDEARHHDISQQRLEALERFGLGPKVVVQEGGRIRTPSAVTGTPSGLERLVKPHLPFLDVGLWRETMARLEGQVCRVEWNGQGLGTAFLVGPDVVLTNHHVAEVAINDPSRAGALRFRFDHRVLATGQRSDGTLVGLAGSNWLLDHSPCSAAELDRRPDDPPSPTEDELDHALLRLARPIGGDPLMAGTDAEPRGWVAVPSAPPVLAVGDPVLILQHPEAAPLKLAADTSGVLGANANGTRLRYATNTERGSSGSPVFDLHWKLAALHHYGDPLQGQALYNQGVPIAAIRDRLRRRGLEGVLGA